MAACSRRSGLPNTTFQENPVRGSLRSPGSGQEETFRKTEPLLAASPLPPGSGVVSVGEHEEEED